MGNSPTNAKGVITEKGYPLDALSNLFDSLDVVIMMGLDGAGKTTIEYTLRLADPNNSTLAWDMESCFYRTPETRPLPSQSSINQFIRKFMGTEKGWDLYGWDCGVGSQYG